MREIVYVDVYFIMNFVMNFFLLSLTAILRQKRKKLFLITGASILGAALSAVFCFLFWKSQWMQGVCAFGVIGGLNWFVFREKSLAQWAKDCFVFLITGLFTGGAVTAMDSLFFRGNVLKAGGGVFWIIAGAGIIFLVFLWIRYELIRAPLEQKTVLAVTVFHKSHKKNVKALLDTGNRLSSPYTGESVVIISAGLAEEIELANGQNPVYIPYQSIGGDGMLPAYRLEKMEIAGKDGREHVLVAVSSHLGDMEEIQMILNII